MKNSVLIRNARILAGNPASMIEGDILIKNGKIHSVGTVSDAPAECVEVDADGSLAMPGLVDPHTHFIADGAAGYRMLVSRGVTTALDTITLGGEATRRAVAKMPVGLTCASFYLLWPGRTLPDDNPDDDEIARALDQARQEGFYGVKIAGAHFPFTPEAMARMIALAAQKRMPLMIHAGSTQSQDDLKGMREVLECCGNNPAILAHVNLYCNGASGKSQCEEVADAVNMLENHPRVVSESTFSELACVGCRMVDGVPESKCLRAMLAQKGYAESFDGLMKGVAEGVFLTSGPVGDYYDWLPPEEGVAFARKCQGQVTFALAMHEPEKNLRILEARRRDTRKFVVNAFSTDGGIVPRNIVLKKGLEAVESGRFTLPEFVERASCGGAVMLGLDGRKGIIAEGADGDVVIVDEKEKAPEYTISGGRVVYCRGRHFPCENRYIASPDHLPAWLE